MAHVNPPYRCDVVGSFLRPKTVAQARVKFACGQISREELTAAGADQIAETPEALETLILSTN